MLKNSEYNGNGSQPKITNWTADEPDEPAEGSLRRAVLDVARECLGKFDGKYVFEKLTAQNFKFGAQKPEVSIHGALISLSNPKKRLIRLVRKGSGRQPNIYEAIRKEGTK